MQNKGALTPFFLSICSPRLRDNELLKYAIEALTLNCYADALLIVEYVCRRHLSNSIPAVLRAKILQSCLPELSVKAWYYAWLTDPKNPILQDVMLSVWLSSGATANVWDLGCAFLPERCRSDTHSALIQLLHQVKAKPIGVCWKSGLAIEGMLFRPAPLKAGSLPEIQTIRLIVSDETSQFYYDVPADGSRFKLNWPENHGVWSLAFVNNASEKNEPQLLHGSPIVFGKQANSVSKDNCNILVSNIAVEKTQVAIIIPVYRDYALVKTCIDSVLISLAQNITKTEVIVIDDASPEPALSAWLDSLAESGRITLLRNKHNLGFIESTNRGLRQCTNRDVVLLNADTLVHGDWIDRLNTALYSAMDVASVTPWSNNGELSSFPRIAKATISPTLPQLIQIDTIAAKLRNANSYTDIELPTCCGFTMMMRRSVLDQIGLLDGVELTRGYLEEVDWCLRARAIGYRHLAATGVFIAHVGTASFGFEKTLLVHQNRAVLVSRYPNYYPEYHKFIRNDPLKNARQILFSELKQSNSEWLASVSHVDEKPEFATVLPMALQSSCTRIAIWQNRASSASANKILVLARAIASYESSVLKLRLLLIGEASEALWHTGVVDVLPSLTKQESTLLSDAALVGLSGCSVLLTENSQTAPIGIPHIQLDTEFEPRAWLESWLIEQANKFQYERNIGVAALAQQI